MDAITQYKFHEGVSHIGDVPFEALPLYTEEVALQADLAAHPNALQREGELPWTLVSREFRLHYGVPGVPAGWLDLLMVRDDGLPCLVEAKLSQNEECFGSVVAQLLRYLHGFMETGSIAAIQAANPSVSLSDNAWVELESAMRSGRARLALALDCAPVELLVAAAALKRTGLDIEVVEMRRDPTGTPVHRHIQLCPLNRRGNWRPLLTLATPCAAHPLATKRGKRRASAVPFPPSGCFRVLEAPPTRHPPHQVDPAREEGLIGVMPNWERLALNGNPYPADPAADPTVSTSERWLSWIAVARHVWEMLAERGHFAISADFSRLIERMTSSSELVLNDVSWEKYRRKAMVDALLDLHLYGMAEVETDGHDYIAELSRTATASLRQHFAN